MRAIAITVGTILLVTGCSGPNSDTSSKSLHIFATTGYLADAALNIAPDAVITTMVGPGGDPHTYQPSTRDIQQMRDADAVFSNGLHLEAQMTRQLDSLGDKHLAVGEELSASDLIDLTATGEDQPDIELADPDSDESIGQYDPHIWNDPELWSQVIALMAIKLGELVPEEADSYTVNAAAYRAELREAHEAATTRFQTLDDRQRTVVTGHDAFGYLGRAYQLDIHATDFISTDAQISPRELSELADLIVTQRVPVIFQDNQANPQAIASLNEAVQARGWRVTISDEELYADSLGSESGVDTYLGVFAHNVAAIVTALGADSVNADGLEPAP